MAVYARMRVAVAVAVCGSVEGCGAEPLMCVCFVPAGWVVVDPRYRLVLGTGH